MEIKIPMAAEEIISRLEDAGFESYVVGGCVRDSIMGRQPTDWDICTAARPEQTAECLSGFKVLETGKKHGTVTVISHGSPFEVTTFRIDGAYSDSRHPDNVTFVKGIKEDLARRDFTVNAMAYSHSRGLMDYFGSREDIEKKILRCVGDADLRFTEDALRIFRAMRFASQLDFKIEEETERAMLRHRGLLGNISRERISSELSKLILGPGAGAVLLRYVYIIGQVIPPILRLYEDSEQVYRRSLRALELSGSQLAVRLALLLKGCAPACEVCDILQQLRYDSKTIAAVEELIQAGAKPISPDSAVLKWLLSRYGQAGVYRLIDMKSAEAGAVGDTGAIDMLKRSAEEVNRIIAEGECFRIGDLAISGKDLIDLGIPEGGDIGRILSEILSRVIDDKLQNIRPSLLKEAKRLYKITPPQN